jgi:hypothetical protein
MDAAIDDAWQSRNLNEHLPGALNDHSNCSQCNGYDDYDPHNYYPTTAVWDEFTDGLDDEERYRLRDAYYASYDDLDDDQGYYHDGVLNRYFWNDCRERRWLAAWLRGESDIPHEWYSNDDLSDDCVLDHEVFELWTARLSTGHYCGDHEDALVQAELDVYLASIGEYVSEWDHDWSLAPVVPDLPGDLGPVRERERLTAGDRWWWSARRTANIPHAQGRVRRRAGS